MKVWVVKCSDPEGGYVESVHATPKGAQAFADALDERATAARKAWDAYAADPGASELPYDIELSDCYYTVRELEVQP